MAYRLMCLGVALLALPAGAAADELPDPTRPPGVIFAPVVSAPEAAPAGLTSILISGPRRAAIIDGVTVELGGRHGDGRLTEVQEDFVVLTNGQARRVLTLFPGVRMTRGKDQDERQEPVNKERDGKTDEPPARKEKK